MNVKTLHALLAYIIAVNMHRERPGRVVITAVMSNDVLADAGGQCSAVLCTRGFKLLRQSAFSQPLKIAFRVKLMSPAY